MDFAAIKTGKADRFPLHPVAVEHLARLVRTDGRVFRGAQTKWKGADRSGSFYRQWRDLQDRAGIERRFTPHDVRRTAASEVERARPGMAEILLQHAPESVTTCHALA